MNFIFKRLYAGFLVWPIALMLIAIGLFRQTMIDKAVAAGADPKIFETGRGALFDQLDGWWWVVAGAVLMALRVAFVRWVDNG